MRRLLLPLLLVPLATPAAAGAKEVTGATLCGADGCRTTHDREGAAAVSDAGALAGPPDHAAPYYTVRLTVTHEGEDVGSWSVRWAPALGVVRSTGADDQTIWFEPTPAAAALLRRLGEGLRPFPAAGLEPLRDAPAQEPATSDSAAAPAGPGGPAGSDGGGDAAAWALGSGAALLVLGGATLLVRGLRRRATARAPVVPNG